MIGKQLNVQKISVNVTGYKVMKMRYQKTLKRKLQVIRETMRCVKIRLQMGLRVIK